MTRLQIGSQEWRNNVFTYPIAVLSTRCGITAPGRSAGTVSPMFPTGGIWNRIVWARQRRMEEQAYHVTRADAAAARWLANSYPHIVGGGPMIRKAYDEL